MYPICINLNFNKTGKKNKQLLNLQIQSDYESLSDNSI